MAYINVGAYVDGARPKSKKALRDAIDAAPETVTFDVTAPLGPRAGDDIAATTDDVGGYTLSVVGPDPYRRRNWYGSVTVKAGALVLK